MNAFQQWWKLKDELHKGEKLSRDELNLARSIIREDQNFNVMSSKTIQKLRDAIPKLSDAWKAERVYWTEVKRDDTKLVENAGEDIGIDKYRVILSPNACKVCRKKTNDGEKIFKASEINKTGYGHKPPFHPNCYCLLVPQV